MANAIGPLAAIHTTVSEQALVAQAEIPLWILLIGALGIALGLSLFGPKLIRTVGSNITKLNRVRAYCVTLSAAITVIIASALGLPVSSTHIAIGALFGVGFLREFLEQRRRDAVLASGYEAADLLEVLRPAAGGEVVTTMQDVTEPGVRDARLAREARRKDKQRRRQLVRRGHVVTIIAAWVITLPMSALIAALLALGLHQVGLPDLD